MLRTFFFFVFMIGTKSAAAIPDFAAALTSMDRGDYQAAAQIYESAVNDGARNGDLFYNLGICYERLQRPGDAIAAFLAARRYLPRDPDVSANLRFTLSKTPDRLETELNRGLFRRLMAWVDHFSLRELAYVGAITWGLSGMFLLASLSVDRLSSFRSMAWFSLLIPFCLTASAILRASTDQPWGAVTPSVAKVLSGPDPANTPLFQLRHGAPFAVVNSKVSDYWLIELSDGKKGWLARTDARVFTAP